VLLGIISDRRKSTSNAPGQRNHPDESGVYPAMANFLFVLIAVVVLVLPGVAAAQGRSEATTKRKSLWAAITVQQPIVPKNRTNDLTLIFAIVNDGDSTVNPGVATSRLFINGVELKEWSFINRNGPKTTFDAALPPKRTLLFSYAVGKYFQKPGAYTVKWQGENFKASEITFRVLPGDL
jgi:hypothetical protein